MKDSMPDGLLKNTRFNEAVLCYLPYHEVRSRRVGTIMTDYKSTGRETGVIAGDVHRIVPALSIDGFGIEETSVFEGLKNDSLELLLFDRIKQGENARIYYPSVDESLIMDRMQMKGFTSGVSDNTEFIETRSRRIYYPVWRLQYRFKGRSYFAVIDGLTGRVIFARAPQGDKWRVLWLVSGVSLSGFISGKMLKGISFIEHVKEIFATGDDSTGAVTGGLLLIIMLAALLSILWVLVWNQFRYAGDVVYEKNSLMVEKQGGLFSKAGRVPVFEFKDIIDIIFKWKRE
jgi:hypothetical protein